MDWTLEVVVVPVSDIPRAIEFYRDRLGFHLDHDTVTPQMHVVQLTPPGSGCSIVLGDMPGQMAPGSLSGVQLVVSDAAAGRAELTGRGVECTELTSFGPEDSSTFFWFSDPDGNAWTVQEMRVRAEKPLIPKVARGSLGE
ncbi:MAG: VOC family protein [Pseudolysinimonas sp.]